MNQNFQDENEALGWYLKVARNYLFNELKRAKKLSPISDCNEMPCDQDMEGSIDRTKLYEIVLSAIPESSRVLLVSHSAGYSLYELARLEHVSLSAIKQRHARTCRILRNSLGKLYNN